MVLQSSGGGAGRHVIDLCDGLARRGHRVVLAYALARAEPLFLEQLAALPVETVPLEMHRSIGLHDIASARSLARLIKDEGPFDIVHGHSAKGGALSRCVPLRGAKAVYTPHAFRSLDPEASWKLRRGYAFIEWILGARTDALIAVSQTELDFAIDHGIARSRGHLIHNGVFNQPKIDVPEVRRALGFAPEHIVVGFVGRLTYQKAPERYVGAMIGAFRADPRFRALLIGDGELRDEVTALIAASGYADRFKLLIGVDAKFYMGAMDLLMITSRYEGFSYVMIEALGAGVPLIATPVGGVAEAIGEDGCGIIVDGLDDVADLSRVLTGLAADSAALAVMKARAQVRGDLFHGDKMIDKTEAVYSAIVQQGRA